MSDQRPPTRLIIERPFKQHNSQERHPHAVPSAPQPSPSFGARRSTCASVVASACAPRTTRKTVIFVCASPSFPGRTNSLPPRSQPIVASTTSPRSPARPQKRPRRALVPKKKHPPPPPRRKPPKQRQPILLVRPQIQPAHQPRQI